MKNLSQILAELANHGSWEGYGLLYFAIAEAVKAQPMPPMMDTLCKKLVGIGGKRNPDTIYRSMARAVDDIWARPESRPLLKEYYRRELVEKPTPDSFISAVAKYLWEQSLQQQAAEQADAYHISFDAASQKYGIISHVEGSLVWASFPALTEDLEHIQRIVRLLCQQNIPLEVFKDFYLSGGFQTEDK